MAMTRSRRSVTVPQAMPSEWHYQDDNVPRRKTAAQQVLINDERARHLRRARTGNAPLRFSIADSIANCEPGARCRNGACEQCNIAFQRFATSSITALWDQVEPLTHISVFAPKLLRPIGELASLTPAECVEAFRELFYAAGFGHLTVVGTIDLCLAANSDCQHPPCWAPHLHSLARSSDTVGLSRALRRLIGKCPPIARPCLCKKIVKQEKQHPYVFKTAPIREVHFIGDDGRLKRATRHLGGRSYVEAWCWLGSSSFYDRMLAMNIH